MASITRSASASSSPERFGRNRSRLRPRPNALRHWRMAASSTSDGSIMATFVRDVRVLPYSA